MVLQREIGGVTKLFHGELIKLKLVMSWHFVPNSNSGARGDRMSQKKETDFICRDSLFEDSQKHINSGIFGGY